MIPSVFAHPALLHPATLRHRACVPCCIPHGSEMGPGLGWSRRIWPCRGPHRRSSGVRMVASAAFSCQSINRVAMGIWGDVKTKGRHGLRRTQPEPSSGSQCAASGPQRQPGQISSENTPSLTALQCFKTLSLPQTPGPRQRMRFIPLLLTFPVSHAVDRRSDPWKRTDGCS